MVNSCSCTFPYDPKNAKGFRRKRKTMRLSLVVVGIVFYSAMTEAFSVCSVRSSTRIPMSSGSTTSSSSLYMAKPKKRGGLAFIVEEGGSMPSTPRKATPKKATATSKKKSSVVASSSSAPISPDLLKFMESKTDDSMDESSSSSTTSTVVAASASPSASVFTAFETDIETTTTVAPSSPRRIKQSARQQVDEEHAAKIAILINQIEETIATSGATMIDELIPLLEELATTKQGESAVNRSSRRQLLSTRKQQLDYRLAWVGSDKAVSHTGTGLHKVALARLQEVFLTLPGRNRVQYTEVIRILGPFPNVKNTLQGSGSVLSSTTNGVSLSTLQQPREQWKIVWDSMIDGTGKELLAGKAENTQTVLLDVWYSNEQVILATLPGKTIRDDRGQNVLVFLRESNMDEKLEALRVA